jgi:hypothetical protein
MGVGDRHSKRATADKAKVPQPQPQPQPPLATDERELDDAFSAWDDDDAGARKPAHPVLAQSTASSARTRLERKPAPLADALVDPVAMRDIVISRARTLDDPLTTRVLAEIARTVAQNEPARTAPLTPRTRTRDAVVRMAPPKFLAAIGTRAGERPPARSPDMIADEPKQPPSPHTPEDADELATPPRRTTRRSISREEPFRKK